MVLRHWFALVVVMELVMIVFAASECDGLGRARSLHLHLHLHVHAIVIVIGITGPVAFIHYAIVSFSEVEVGRLEKAVTRLGLGNLLISVMPHFWLRVAWMGVHGFMWVTFRTHCSFKRVFAATRSTRLLENVMFYLDMYLAAV